MKKNSKYTVCGLLLGLLFASSCSKDSDQHQLWIAYPTQNYHILFADQYEDSIVFVTTDNWWVNPRQNEWMRVEGDNSGTVMHDNFSRYWVTKNLEFAPNTTNQTRIGIVDVYAYDYQVSASYMQMGHLDVWHPQPTVDSLIAFSNIPAKVSFTLTDSASVISDSICFMVYNRWTLSVVEPTQASWLTLNKTTGGAGKQRIDLLLQQNETSEDRIATLLLKSGEVTNKILVKQLAKKEE